ncbi:MAG: hypothetical protein GC206_13225 [Alphaproteobacteria bacterium]|nr:hypothetical protein [Alphaproteobacteria bacterium]
MPRPKACNLKACNLTMNDVANRQALRAELARIDARVGALAGDALAGVLAQIGVARVRVERVAAGETIETKTAP